MLVSAYTWENSDWNSIMLKSLRLVPVVLLAMFVLAACGNKGPLVLPDQKPQAKPQTQPQQSATPSALSQDSGKQ